MKKQMQDHSQEPSEDSVLDENNQLKPDCLEIWAKLAKLENYWRLP